MIVYVCTTVSYTGLQNNTKLKIKQTIQMNTHRCMLELRVRNYQNVVRLYLVALLHLVALSSEMLLSHICPEMERNENIMYMCFLHAHIVLRNMSTLEDYDISAFAVGVVEGVIRFSGNITRE